MRTENQNAEKKALDTYKSLVATKDHDDLFYIYKKEMDNEIKDLFAYYMKANGDKAGLSDYLLPWKYSLFS